MNHAMPTPSPRAPRQPQAGFTIVEMMVALSISMVILLGFAVSFVNMKSTFNSQNSLLQLQDNERLALTILNTSIGEAGFFPNGSNLNAVPAVPIQNVARSSVVLGTTSVPGDQMIDGQYLRGTPGDLTSTPVKPETLSTAYASAPGDGLLTCLGGAGVSTTATTTMRNTFYVDPLTHTLMCEVMTREGTAAAVTKSAQPLISNVNSMSVVYGLTSGSGNVDVYKTTAQMANPGDYDNVKNIKVTLQFINPNDATKPISWTQAINVMNNK